MKTDNNKWTLHKEGIRNQLMIYQITIILSPLNILLFIINRNPAATRIRLDQHQSPAKYSIVSQHFKTKISAHIPHLAAYFLSKIIFQKY